jgi:hypothetical protein
MTEKKAVYVAPKAVFVPLKVEERLLACVKGLVQGYVCIYGINAS